MTSAFGLLLAIMAWVGAMRAIAWTWNKHVLVIAGSGFPVDERDRRIGIGRVVRYHTLGWTAALFILFALLTLSAFSLWQLLAFAGLLSLVYGTHAIGRGESEWIGREDPEAVALFGRLRDTLWYRVLMVVEWAAYLASIVFASTLLVGLVT